MPRMTLKGRAKLWLYDSPGGWHFLTLPKAMAPKVKMAASSLPRGWGSVRVTATIGATSWDTSVFPEKDSGSYVLPVKKAVRAAETLGAGDTVEFTLECAY